MYETGDGMDGYGNFTQLASAFVVLFAIIDVLGSVPMFLTFRDGNRKIHPFQAALYAFLILVFFLFAGRLVLDLFTVDVSSFAVAGSLVIFIVSVEMIFGIEVFKNDAPGGSKTLVPIVFPLIAGPGTLTTLLSMRAEYPVAVIVAALFLNMVVVYLVLGNLDRMHKLIGASGVYVMRKFFGVILMAIAVKLFTSNFSALLATLS